jgi:hypothetical protein
LNAKQLRSYATRLMAFALKALEEGDFAKRLLAGAAECLDKAQLMEMSQQERARVE